MRILVNELKKIFNIKSIVVLILINILLYWMFVQFHIKYFPNGRPAADDYRISVQMIKDKGNNLKDEDINYLYNMRDNMVKEADNYLKNNEKAKSLNITSYASYAEADCRSSKALESFDNDIMFKDGVNVFWELQVINSNIDQFKGRENSVKSLLKTKSAQDRMNEIIKNKSRNSILPYFVLDNYNSLITYSSEIILISIIFMIVPIFTRDKKKSLELLQYTTKRGRALYKDKIKTAFVASTIIITIQLGILFFLYVSRSSSVSMFYDSNINSCFSSNLSWLDITFKQYIILTVILVYIVGFITTLITCYISRKISSYIALIGVLIPVSITLIYVTNSIILDRVGNLFSFKYKIPIIIIVLSIVGIILIVARYRKEKNLDIVL